MKTENTSSDTLLLQSYQLEEQEHDLTKQQNAKLITRLYALSNALESWANMAEHGTKALQGYDKRTIELMILGSRTEIADARALLAQILR